MRAMLSGCSKRPVSPIVAEPYRCRRRFGCRRAIYDSPKVLNRFGCMKIKHKFQCECGAQVVLMFSIDTGIVRARCKSCKCTWEVDTDNQTMRLEESVK